MPISFTPCLITILSRSVSGQLPPCSTAMSTITEPGFIALTVSSFNSTGAGPPGMSAVVMMMSAALARSCISSAWRRIQSAGIGARVTAGTLGDLAFFVREKRYVQELGAQRSRPAP